MKRLYLSNNLFVAFWEIWYKKPAADWLKRLLIWVALHYFAVLSNCGYCRRFGLGILDTYQ